MTNYLFAGGGTAGHVNPMLAIADGIRRREPQANIVCVGTKEGLEAELVPAKGYEFITIARLPFPRPQTVFTQGVKFLQGWGPTVSQIETLIVDRKIDVVVGVGGYASAPAYEAARRTKTPLVIHEANAKPGIANKWAARFTPFVGVTFANTKIKNARVVGTPLRREIEELDIALSQVEARKHFGLDPHRPVLMVTGGSQGARHINQTIVDSAEEIVAAGYQILHIVGQNKPEKLPEMVGYVALDYCNRMDLALAAATVVVSRAGSATVSELSALGIPAVYVPYPVGNGEQRFNAAGVVEVGGGVLVNDAAFTSSWVHSDLIALLRDEERISQMGARAKSVGVLDGTQRMINLIDAALS